MKTITATDLKSNTGDFFEALLMDGGVIITRNGKKFPLKLLREEQRPTPKQEKSFSEELVEAVSALARSIPIEERDAVGRDMMAALKEHRAEVNIKRRSEME